MSQRFKTLVTKIGQEKIAEAIAENRKLELTQIAFGSSSSSINEDMTKLRDEKYRNDVQKISINSKLGNRIEVRGVIPAREGGWWIREIGVFDKEGDLIIVANTPESYKPTMEEGAVKDLVFNIIVEVSNLENIKLELDPSAVFVLRDELTELLTTHPVGSLKDIQDLLATDDKFLSIHLTQDVDLRGRSLFAKDKDLLEIDGRGYSFTNVESIDIVDSKDVFLKNLTVKEGEHTGVVNIVRVERAKNLFIDNISIESAGIDTAVLGFDLYLDKIDLAKITNSTFANPNNVSKIDAIQISRIKQAVVDNCLISNNTDGIVINDFGGAASSYIADVTISNCVFRNNTENMIRVIKPTNLDIMNNHFTGVNGEVSILKSDLSDFDKKTPAHIKVIGNTFSGNINRRGMTIMTPAIVTNNFQNTESYTSLVINTGEHTIIEKDNLTLREGEALG